MSKVKITAEVDLVAAIEEALGNASLDSVGEGSEYSLDDITVVAEGGGGYTVEIELEVSHISGKYVGKDELAEEIMEQLDSIEFNFETWKTI